MTAEDRADAWKEGQDLLSPVFSIGSGSRANAGLFALVIGGELSFPPYRRISGDALRNRWANVANSFRWCQYLWVNLTKNFQEVLNRTLPTGNICSMKKLIAYIRHADDDERRRVCEECRTSIGYLRKAASVGQLLGAGLCVRIRRSTGGAVTRRDLRPDDWHQIWPELVDQEKTTTA